jgi:hypothetical protein
VKLRAPLALALGIGLPAAAAAQTTDAVFAGWRWAPPSVTSRPAGLGGAFVAISDGVNAIAVNPAGVALIPITEVHLASGPWFAVGRHVQHFSLAAYATKSGHQDLEPEDTRVAGATLDASIWDVGVALAAAPTARVRIGATGAWSRLRVDGTRAPSAGGPTTLVGGSSAHFKLTTGMLVTLVGDGSRSLPSLRLGVSYQPGYDWRVDVAEGTAQARSIAYRKPSVAALGFAWRPSDRWTFSAQTDLVRYREVVDALRRNVGERATGFRLSDAVEPRFGTEFGAPLWCGCGIVKFRGGVHYRSPGTLVYEGPDPIAAQAFRSRNWRTLVTGGVSLLSEHFGNALRLDLDSGDLVRRRDFSASIVWRF